ncbi:hypothetical protein HDU76_003053, partial [Blyttiomyces sp. JEL0837]
MGSGKNKNNKKKPQQPTSVGRPATNVTGSVETTRIGTEDPRVSKVSSVDKKLCSSLSSCSVDLGSAGSSTTVTTRSSTVGRTSTTTAAGAGTNIAGSSTNVTSSVETVPNKPGVPVVSKANKPGSSPASSAVDLGSAGLSARSSTTSRSSTAAPAGAAAPKINVPNPSEKSTLEDTTVEARMQAKTLKNKKKKDKKRAKALASEEAQKVETDQGMGLVEAAVKETGAIKLVGGDSTVEVMNDGAVGTSSGLSVAVETTATSSLVEPEESSNVEVSQRATGVDAALEVKTDIVEKQAESSGLATEGTTSSENMGPAVSMLAKREFEHKVEQSAIEDEDESIVVAALEATKIRLELELARILGARDQVVHLSVVHGHTISIIKRGLVELSADPDKVYRVAEVEALKEQGYLVAAQGQDEAVVTVSTTAVQKNTTVPYGLLDYAPSVIAAEVETVMKAVVGSQSVETMNEEISAGSSALGQAEIGSGDENMSIHNDPSGSSSEPVVEVEAGISAGSSAVGQAEIDENMSVQGDASSSSSALVVDVAEVEDVMNAVTASQSFDAIDERISNDSGALGQVDSASSDTSNLIQHDTSPGSSSVDEIAEAASTPSPHKDTSVRYGLFNYPGSVIAAEVETGIKSVGAAASTAAIIDLGQQDVVSSNVNKSIAIEDATFVTTESSEVAETVGKVVPKDKGKCPVAIREDMSDSENESKDKVGVVTEAKSTVADMVHPMAGQSGVKEGENLDSNRALDVERKVLDLKVRGPAVEEGLGSTAMESSGFDESRPAVAMLPKMKVEHKSDLSTTAESNTKAAHLKAEIARLNREIENASSILTNEKRVCSFQACVLKHFEAQFEAIKEARNSNTAQVTKVAAPAESTLVSSKKDEAVDGQDDWPAAK